MPPSFRFAASPPSSFSSTARHLSTAAAARSTHFVHTHAFSTPLNDSEEIVNWVKKRTGPPTVHAEEAKPIEGALKGTSSFILGYFDKFEVSFVYSIHQR